MISTKKHWVAGVLAAGSLVCVWLYQRGMEPSAASSAKIEDYSTGTPTQSLHGNLPASDDRELREAKAAEDGMQIAYRTLARSTALPDGSVDPTGRTLPKEFAVYLANENEGYDQFVAGLPADAVASFKTLKQSVENLGAARFTEFVAKNCVNEKPSTFDFVLYTSLRELGREYPAINDVTKASIARNWGLLSQSANPVFRLLAIDEATRVIKDKAAALALLDARTNEVDPVIVHALIDQLAVIGGEAAKSSLTRILDDARVRRDQAAVKAVEDAIAKLK